MTLGYDLVQYRGEFYSDGRPKLVTKRIAQAMAKLELALGYGPQTLDLPQGCHHDGSLSAGTHSRADVFDLSYDNADDKARAGMALGIVVFVRDYNWDGHSGAAHCHCLLRGSEHLSAEAARQLTDWDKHLNALASHAGYTGHPWGPVSDFVYEPHWSRDASDGHHTSSKHKPHQAPQFREILAARVQLGALHARGWEIHEDLTDLVKQHPHVPALASAVKDIEKALPKIRNGRSVIEHWLNKQAA